MHNEQTPRARRDAMITAQSLRYRLLIPDGSRSHASKGWRSLGALAQRAAEFRPQVGGSIVIVHHPGPYLEWWTVTNVLIVTAVQFRDPITHHILVETRYRPFYDQGPDSLVRLPRGLVVGRHITPSSDGSSGSTAKVWRAGRSQCNVRIRSA